MPEFVVAAESRTETGKSPNRRLRGRGLIPGVVYGAGKDTQPVAVSPDAIIDILHSDAGENTLFDLEIGGERRKVILKEFQREPLRGQLLHADFFEVALDRAIEVKVHIELEGTPVGVKNQGGLLDFITRELEIECLPTEIPAKISVDVTGLELNRHLRVSDVKVPDGVTVLTDSDIVVATVVTPRADVAAAEEAAEAEVAAEGAEPAVAGKAGKAKPEGEAEEKQ